MNTILITGANRGIGLELTNQYLASGWRVIACCRDPKHADKLQALKTTNLNIIKLDVSRVEEINAIKQQLANESIDILMNNAGVYGPDAATFGTIDATTWLEVLKINTVAPLLLTQALVNQVAKSELKIVANMSSKMGSIALNTEGNSYYYRSSKAALNAVTKSLALDLSKQKIIVVTLHPGWVQTDMGGVNALITPEISVKSLHKVLSSLTMSDTGSYINYDGKKLAW